MPHNFSFYISTNPHKAATAKKQTFYSTIRVTTSNECVANVERKTKRQCEKKEHERSEMVLLYAFDFLFFFQFENEKVKWQTENEHNQVFDIYRELVSEGA